MPGPSRDLAVPDLWSASLERSRARRARAGGRRIGGRSGRAFASNLLLGASAGNEARDLATAELWELSLGRSRARRRAAELRFVPTGTRAKRASLGALAALTVGPTASLADGPATAAAPPSGSPNPPATSEHAVMLSLESEGRQVKLLQSALSGVKVDGVFGPETEEAVRRFQSGRGLAVDGVVGPATIAALRSQATTMRFASMHSELPGESTHNEQPGEALGSAGASSEAAQAAATTSGEGNAASAAAEAASQSAVRRLQAALHLPVDGEFGPQTEAAVQRLQSRHGLSADGVVGPATWGSVGVHGETTLTPPASAQPEPAAGAEGEGQGAAGSTGGNSTSAIRRLQAALHLSVDGEFGPDTEAAIQRLQARHGLSVDGVVGPATWGIIGVSSEGTLDPPRSAFPQPEAHSAEGSSDSSEGASRGSEGSSRSSEGGSDSSEGSSRSSEGSEGGGSGEERHSSEPERSSSSSSSSTGGGEGSGAVGRVIAAGNEIATRPYVYGGGHGSFQSNGYDCSGSVSYALHGGGLINSPQDSTSLESYGESGPGKHITIYANSEHAFMVVNGKRFDTVAQQEGGSRWSSSMTSTSGYTVRHPAGY